MTFRISDIRKPVPTLTMENVKQHLEANGFKINLRGRTKFKDLFRGELGSETKFATLDKDMLKSEVAKELSAQGFSCIGILGFAEALIRDPLILMGGPLCIQNPEPDQKNRLGYAIASRGWPLGDLEISVSSCSAGWNKGNTFLVTPFKT